MLRSRRRGFAEVHSSVDTVRQMPRAGQWLAATTLLTGKPNRLFGFCAPRRVDTTLRPARGAPCNRRFLAVGEFDTVVRPVPPATDRTWPDRGRRGPARSRPR